MATMIIHVCVKHLFNIPDIFLILALKINCEKAKQIIELIYDPSSIMLTTIKIKYCVEFANK
jgi:hypothetical protein